MDTLYHITLGDINVLHPLPSSSSYSDHHLFIHWVLRYECIRMNAIPFIIAAVLAAIIAALFVMSVNDEYETIMNNCLIAAHDSDAAINNCWANEPE